MDTTVDGTADVTRFGDARHAVARTAMFIANGNNEEEHQREMAASPSKDLFANSCDRLIT
jgi:hypothetical protein